MPEPESEELVVVKNGQTKHLPSNRSSAAEHDETETSTPHQYDRGHDGSSVRNVDCAPTGSTEVVYESKVGVELRKSIKFSGAVAILLGNIGGTSIFIAPTTILALTGSPGLAVIMWSAGGLLTWSIAYSICELALLLPGAGGPYIYTLKVFGNIPGFIILWGFVLLIGFPSWALASYAGSLYILSLFYPSCRPPDSVVKLVAAWLLGEFAIM